MKITENLLVITKLVVSGTHCNLKHDKKYVILNTVYPT